MSEIDYQMALLLQHKFESEVDSKLQRSDMELALLLQEEFKREQEVNHPSNNLVYEDKKKKNPNLNSSKCLVDPSWEVIDPTPDIHNLFMAFNDRFFWNKLLSVCVSWSKRMTTCAGICSYQGRGGLCSITLSEPLLKLRPRKDLVETLLHEMIHAFLFVTHNNKDRDGHGPEFHKHMYRINTAAGTHITVYHDFHDEVRLYKQHWWKCDGPCQKWKPYFGMVRRAQNRAPGPNDRWWGEHSRNCGGVFIKVKEPEKEEKKTSTKKGKVEKKPTEDIRKYVTTSKASANINSINNSIPKNSTTGNNKVQSLKNHTSDTKISPIIQTTSNNIFGFVNLDKPSSSKTVISGNKNVTGFSSDKSQIKGAVSNRSNTIVVNKTKITNTSPSKPISSILNKTVTKGKTNNRVKGNDYNDNYFAVRNYWINKYGNNQDNNNKRVSSEKIGSSSKVSKISSTDVHNIPSSSKKQKTISEKDLVEDLVTCPICSKKMYLGQLDAHIDTCLETKNTEKVCIICEKTISVVEYEKHVVRCTDENFSDWEFVIQSPTQVLPSSSPKDLRDNNNSKIENPELKKCPACESMISSDKYDFHVEKCLLKMYDSLEATYGINTNDCVNCLACDKKVLKKDLDSHLEDCMSMSNVFDDSNVPVCEDEFDKPENEPKYNCPCCMKLILEKDMNSHIDKCLNISETDLQLENERMLLHESFEDDF